MPAIAEAELATDIQGHHPLARNGPHVFGVLLDMIKRSQRSGIAALRTHDAVATLRIRALAEILPESSQQ